MIVVWKSTPPRCNCEKAAAYWKKYDEEMEKRKKGEEQERRQKAFDERVKAVFDKSCLPKRFLSRTFDSFNRTNEVQSRAYNKANEYTGTTFSQKSIMMSMQSKTVLSGIRRTKGI